MNAAQQSVPPATLPVPKRLSEMNRLADMGRFPIAVYCGATGNVLLTILATRWVQANVAWMLPTAGSHAAPGWLTLLLWLALVLTLNLMPVVLLRLFDREDPTHFRYVHEMNFFADQHRFSDWVYIAASANMSFWIVVAWAVFSSFPGPRALALLLAVAFVATFSPALVRLAGVR